MIKSMRGSRRNAVSFLGLWCVVVLWGMTMSVFAQQEPAFNQYWKMTPQFNPATAGRSEQLTVNAAYQVHATGFEDAGGTMYAGADIAFRLGKSRHGAGVLFQNDEIGLFSHKRFSLQYSYHFNLWGGQFSVGPQLDMLAEAIKGSKAILGEGSDPAFPSTDVNGSKFDASFGLYYQHKKWYTGISALHLTAPMVLIGNTHQYHYKCLYNFTAGYNINIPRSFIRVVPSTMLRYDGTDFRADITGRVVYEYEKKKLYGGFNYSPQHSVAAFFGGTFHGVDISYAYEANTSGMGWGAGNHEITISYRLPINLEKKKKNLHKSVRFL